MMRVTVLILVCLAIYKPNFAQTGEYWQKAEAAKTAEDMSGALKWYALSAEQEKVPTAAYNVGIIYEYGLVGGNKDMVKALEWYRKAGELGSYEGYFALAKFYSDKWYESADESSIRYYGDKTKEYYRKAIALGDPDAAKKLSLFEAEENAFWAKQNKYKADLKSSASATQSTSTSTYTQGNTGTTVKRRICSECRGTGKVHVTFTTPQKDSNGYTIYGEYRMCSFCGGQGYMN